MIPPAVWAAFALVALGLVLTPGPNMAFVVSRAITQGRAAGLIALAGVGLGLVTYMLLAACGITGILLAVPLAYDALRIGGALYLAWLAWQSLRPGGRSPFEVHEIAPASPGRLFAMGLLTCLLNPKVAVLYVALLPQFVDPARGHPMAQTLLLGATQVCIAVTGNGIFALAASQIATLFQRHPGVMRIQRVVMGCILASFAIRMALDSRR
jgi:threonine/homoserine/homoserine lactone efflux protein